MRSSMHASDAHTLVSALILQVHMSLSTTPVLAHDRYGTSSTNSFHFYIYLGYLTSMISKYSSIRPCICFRAMAGMPMYGIIGCVCLSKILFRLFLERTGLSFLFTLHY
ncbi:hypothetical protein BGZ63DRAFT_48588 [Mariannaea sp. PMI_226]|nr:hypothetical protein BGZ63DRAFT_48588 [Mariannaea sp. PMI_226]